MDQWTKSTKILVDCIENNSQLIIFGDSGVKEAENFFTIYCITCVQRPLKESNESGLLQQMFFKCWFY